MRILKWIVGVIVVVVVLFAAVGMLLPREVAVARSITIDAPPDAVFPHVNSLKATEAWSPWLSRDPETALSYEGPGEGVGSKMSWSSEHPNVGVGTQEIITSDTNKLVETALDFGDMGTAKAHFVLEEEGNGTKITWGFTSDNGYNPMMRWMGLMMDSWVGGDYEQGLVNLKELVEG